jgi:signal transduction histidine kinase
MSIKNNTLKIIVKDDGVGFDPEVDAGIGHNGLKNMQRRMNEINGSFEIKSNAGEGSTLTFMAEL